MKKTILSCLCSILVICSIKAQNTNADVHIGIICPEQIDDLSAANLQRLRHKIEQIATANGVATYSDGTFILYPEFDFFDVRTVESGMKNIIVVNTELTLSVMQVSTGMKVNYISVSLSGSGFNKPEAVANAISKIVTQSPVYAKFLSESKTRIYSYYETNCSKLLQKAKALTAQQQYEAALAELACFPASLPSYAQVVSVMMDIYERYQNVRCERLIQESKGCIALKDYSGAVEHLVQIDPESRCNSECTRLLDRIKQQVDKEEAEAIERKFRVFDTLVDLEKQRISVIRDIAKTYYSNQPTIQYTQIVK